MNHSALFFVIVSFLWLSDVARSDSTMQAPSLNSGLPVPYFYQLFKDGAATEEVEVGAWYTANFYGKKFGEGDMVKLVEEGKSCSAGVPAGGVPISSVLVSSEELSTWIFSVKKPGTYAVCYFHATNGVWIEVNPRAGRPIPEEKEGDMTTQSPSPDCPVLSDNVQQFPYTVVGVTVERSLGKTPREVVGELSTFVAQISCLTPSDVATLQLRSSGQASSSGGESLSWYFTIVCSNCDYVERMNYLLYYFSVNQKVFHDVGISSVRGEFHVPVEVGDGKINSKHFFVTFLLFFLCLFFFVGGVFCLCILRRERDRREQFDGMDNGFGLLDGDMEDLFPAASNGEWVEQRDHSQGAGGNPADAAIGLIEVEE